MSALDRFVIWLLLYPLVCLACRFVAGEFKESQTSVEKNAKCLVEVVDIAIYVVVAYLLWSKI